MSGPELVTKCHLCGYEFPERLGRYGCPNCLGEGLEAAKAWDEHDPTGYYRRKAQRHAASGAWSVILLVAFCALAGLYGLVTALLG